MKLAAHSTALLELEMPEGLDLLRRLEIGTVELACGGVFTDLRYGDPAQLLGSHAAFTRWHDEYRRRGIAIEALSIHGEPLSPDPDVATRYEADFVRACRFAEALGISRLALTAGLPAARLGDKTPAWIVALPPDFPGPTSQDLAWQWEERLLPYWQRLGPIAANHGCRLCFEMTAWDLVYNPHALRRLHQEIGQVVACNFDPSHLFYQGIDVLAAVEELGSLIALVHAKDTRFNPRAISRRGLYDLHPSADLADQPWSFATVGTGHDTAFWSEFVARLRLHGYDDILSIEEEDPHTPLAEGLERSAAFLRDLLRTADSATPLGRTSRNASDRGEQYGCE